MKAPPPPLTPKAREAAAIERIVELIHQRVAPEGHDPVVDLENNEIVADSKTVTYGKTFTTALWVRTTVDFLQDIFAAHDEKSPWGIKSENEKSIIELNKRIQAVQESLNDLPAGAQYLLFSSGRPEAFDMSARDLIVEEYEKVVARRRNFATMMRTVSNRLNQLADDPPGERATTDYRQKLVTYLAADLLDWHGIKPTRGKDDKASLFEQVAMELLEAATGKASASLTHSCRETLKSWKSKGYYFSNFNES